MPNGWYESPERFRELEEPLGSIDALFEGFARRLGVAVGRNYHEHPERRITVQRDAVTRCICVSVVTGGEGLEPGPNGAAYILSAMAWHDVPDGRWHWHRFFCQWPVIPPKAQVEIEMERAWSQCEAIQKGDMSFFAHPPH